MYNFSARFYTEFVVRIFFIFNFYNTLLCLSVCVCGASLLNRRRQQQITKHKIQLTAKCLMALAIYGSDMYPVHTYIGDLLLPRIGHCHQKKRERDKQHRYMHYRCRYIDCLHWNYAGGGTEHANICFLRSIHSTYMFINA